MIAYTRKFKFVNFYNLYFSLAYNPDNGTEPSMGESNSHLTSFLCIFFMLRLSFPFPY